MRGETHQSSESKDIYLHKNKKKEQMNHKDKRKDARYQSLMIINQTKRRRVHIVEPGQPFYSCIGIDENFNQPSPQFGSP